MENVIGKSARKRGRGKHLNERERKAIQDAFLQSFSVTANIRASCLSANIDRNMIYQWLEHDAEFSLRYRQAEQDANDVVRAAITQRAIQGVPEPVVSNGKIVYMPDGQPLTVQKYSDSLLSLLARARLPEFKEKPTATPDTAEARFDADLMPHLTSEELDTIDSIMKVAQERKMRAEAERAKSPSS